MNDPLRKCTICGKEAHTEDELDLFEKRPTHQYKYGRANRCVACNNERQKGVQRRFRERRREFINKFKDVPCTDCGERHPFYVMDFDHLPQYEKKFDLYKAIGRNYSEKVIEEEIKKCEVVCANCHRKRTHQRRENKYAD